MTDPRWQRLREIVPEAIALPPDERAVFLDRACVIPNGVDGELRAEAGRLLAAAEAAELSGALSSPLTGLAAAAVSGRD